MNPFTPKTDHNLNSPHGINRPTNIESITIQENPNWRIIFYYKHNVTSNSRNKRQQRETHSYQLGEFFLQNLGVHESININ